MSEHTEVAFPSAEQHHTPNSESAADRMRLAAERLETMEGATRRDRATASLLRSMSLRTDSVFVVAGGNGVMRGCCDLGSPCEAHQYAFILAESAFDRGH